MVKVIEIYIEGGSRGQDRASSQKLRIGFAKFLEELSEEARSKKIKFSIQICGSTDQTFKIFESANKKDENTFRLMLVDSDNPLEETETPKSFLQNNKDWDLKNVDEEQCHLMVQIMESWFFADIEALKIFYGKGFQASAFPKNENVEKVPKDDVEKSLAKATEKTAKGKYHKIRQGGDILGKIQPFKVKNSAKHCQLLFTTIYHKIDGD